MDDKLNKPYIETFIDDTTEVELLEEMKRMVDDIFDEIEADAPEGD